MTLRITTALLIWCAAMALPLPASAQATFTTLYSFCTQGAFPDCTDGLSPEAGLIQAANGAFYGTTNAGGETENGGTVFKITPGGSLTTVSSFCAYGTYPSCTDGGSPTVGLIQASDGGLYGTTYVGGRDKGFGTIFKFSPTNGALTTLYSFCPHNKLHGICTDGLYPNGLIEAANGAFYGTTEEGGANVKEDYCRPGCGTIFKITASGALTTLYSFCSQTNCTDGYFPTSGLIQGTDGNFYGTTLFGGAYGFGTVFKLSPGGTLTTLHSFDNIDGAYPEASLIQGTDDNFYGTASAGGANFLGTVFKMTPGGAVTTLHSFDGTDGEWPYAPLIRATDGNFYGLTNFAGSHSGGTVFTITPGGTLTTLYDFCSQPGCTDGGRPEGALIQGTDGAFYGTTSSYGATEDSTGTVFRLSVGLGPFVETVPASQKVGRMVRILGTDLTGAGSVTFNGTAATFTVTSKSEIITTVPPGATSGFVEVTTPGGTLKSNAAFTVTP